MTIRLMVYFDSPKVLIALMTHTPNWFRLFGELPPSVAIVKLKRRFGKERSAATTRCTRLLMVSWFWPPSMSKSIPSRLEELYRLMKVVNPASDPQVKVPAAPPVEI